MSSDQAYTSTFRENLNTVLKGSGGDWSKIPPEYLSHFFHTYVDGDISLIPLSSKLEKTEFLEEHEIGSVLEILSKVDPRVWPDPECVESIDAELLLNCGKDEPLDFVEDNLGTADKVEKVLKSVIENSFGKGVTSIRSHKGKYPSPENNFLQEEDGTFSGTFVFGPHKFNFEIAPTELGWICTYRMSEKSLDNLEKPEFKGKRKGNKKFLRKVRNQGWR